MKKLLCITLWTLILSGCGLNQMPQKLDQTNERMEQLIRNTDEVTLGAKKQSKLIPFENMLKEENSENLSPFPSRLIPFGRELAKVLSAEETVEMTYLWLREVDEVYPVHKLDAQGEDIPYTPEEVKKINHEKMARLMGLQIIAGFLPQTIVDEIIQNQIHSGGRYEDTAYALLMLRVQFIRDVLLEGGLFATPLNNAGKLAQAIEYNKSLELVARLPFVGKIALKTKGLIPTEISPAERFNPEIALQNWHYLQTAAESQCEVKPESLTGDPTRDQVIYQRKLDSYNHSKKVIKSHIDSWVLNPGYLI